MKTPIAIATACAALGLSALAAAPAQASHYPLDTMSASMMTAAQARTLGVAGEHIRTFEYLKGTKKSPDDIWLCDLAGDKEIEVETDGSPELYEVEYASQKSGVETDAGQDLYTFSSEAEARKAMKSIRKAAKKCVGTFTAEDEGVVFRQNVSHGTGTSADGAGFTWIKHKVTGRAASASLGDNEYNTFRRIGQFVQVISIEVAGINAPKLTSSHIKTADRLTGTLGDYWAW